jgi:hypothetical protein
MRPIGDDRVLVRNRAVMRGAGSGVPVEAQGVQLWSFRNGVPVEMRLYQSLDDVPDLPG